MVLLRKRILEMSFGPATTFFGPARTTKPAGPQDDDWNADSHERWTKCCDLAMLLVFLVAAVAAAADAHIAAIGAALVAAVAAAATAFAAA